MALPWTLGSRGSIVPRHGVSSGCARSLRALPSGRQGTCSSMGAATAATTAGRSPRQCVVASAADSIGGPAAAAAATTPPEPLAGAASQGEAPLTDKELSAFVQAHGIQAELVKLPSRPLPPGCAIVKSLVFLANAQPVLVIARIEDKVEERKVAAQLGVSRRRVRLATTDEALAASGYVVGTVPPFGHRQPLRTLVDLEVTHCQQVFGGGGHPDMDIAVQVSELLEVTKGEVTDLRASKAKEPAFELQPLLLPEPWPAGSEMVRLIGVVAQRRRIAKLLLFVSLVPEVVPALPPDGTAAYLRRLWRSPEDPSQAIEVQLICGKTLERSLGREAAEQLLDRIKTGAIISVTGRVQPHLPNRGGAAGSGAGGDDAGNGAGGVQGRHAIIDVVAHQVHVLHRNKDMLQKALRVASRAAGQELHTAAELEHFQQLGSSGEAYRSNYTGLVGGSSSSSSSSSNSSLDGDGDEAAGASAAASAATAAAVAAIIQRPWPPSSARGAQPVASQQQTASQLNRYQPAGLAAPQDGRWEDAEEDGGTYWRLPLLESAVQLVDDVAGLRRMRSVVFASVSASDGASPLQSEASPTNTSSSTSNDGTSSSSSSGSGSLALPPTLIAFDAEWVPFERGQPRTPVSLLQVALRDQVFLVDLLALCRQQEGEGLTPWEASAAAATSSSAGLTESEAELSAFLSDVAASPSIVKCGFHLGSDLQRLRESYPWLPCWRGGQPLRMHVDMGQLVHRRLPAKAHLRHVGLSRLVDALLGAPLNKQQQRSNWAQRPLTAAQCKYAAGDAHVLIMCFDRVLAEAGIGGGDAGELAEALAGLSGGLDELPANGVVGTSSTNESSSATDE